MIWVATPSPVYHHYHPYSFVYLIFHFSYMYTPPCTGQNQRGKRKMKVCCSSAQYSEQSGSSWQVLLRAWCFSIPHETKGCLHLPGINWWWLGNECVEAETDAGTGTSYRLMTFRSKLINCKGEVSILPYRQAIHVAYTGKNQCTIARITKKCKDHDSMGSLNEPKGEGQPHVTITGQIRSLID